MCKNVKSIKKKPWFLAYTCIYIFLIHKKENRAEFSFKKLTELIWDSFKNRVLSVYKQQNT